VSIPASKYSRAFGGRTKLPAKVITCCRGCSRSHPPLQDGLTFWPLVSSSTPSIHKRTIGKGSGFAAVAISTAQGSYDDGLGFTFKNFYAPDFLLGDYGESFIFPYISRIYSTKRGEIYRPLRSSRSRYLNGHCPTCLDRSIRGGSPRG